MTSTFRVTDPVLTEWSLDIGPIVDDPDVTGGDFLGTLPSSFRTRKGGLGLFYPFWSLSVNVELEVLQVT